jgi:hypothetical protein
LALHIGLAYGRAFVMVGIVSPNFFGLRYEMDPSVRFWTNIWCGDHSLKDLYSDLFALAVDKEASIASYLDQSSKLEVRHWNPHFSHSLQDWELESADSFFKVLYVNAPSLTGPNKVLWKPSKKGRFQVR